MTSIQIISLIQIIMLISAPERESDGLMVLHRYEGACLFAIRKNRHNLRYHLRLVRVSQPSSLYILSVDVRRQAPVIANAALYWRDLSFCMERFQMSIKRKILCSRGLMKYNISIFQMWVYNCFENLF